MIPHICRLIVAAVKNPGHALEVLQALAPFFDLETIEKAGEFLEATWQRLKRQAAPAAELVEPVGQVEGNSTDGQGETDTKSESSTNTEADAVSSPSGETATEPVETVGQVEATEPPAVETVSAETPVEPAGQVEATEPAAVEVEAPKPRWTPKRKAA